MCMYMYGCCRMTPSRLLQVRRVVMPQATPFEFKAKQLLACRSLYMYISSYAYMC